MFLEESCARIASWYIQGILKSQILDGKSMYVSSKKHRFLSSSIAGGIIPISLGVALGLKEKNLNKRRGYL